MQAAIPASWTGLDTSSSSEHVDTGARDVAKKKRLGIRWEYEVITSGDRIKLYIYTINQWYYARSNFILLLLLGYQLFNSPLTVFGSDPAQN